MNIRKGWGEFDVKLRINFKSDRLKQLVHQHDLKLYHGPDVGVSQFFETDLKVRVPEDMLGGGSPDKAAVKKDPEKSLCEVAENTGSSETEVLKKGAANASDGLETKGSEVLEVKVTERSSAKASLNTKDEIPDDSKTKKFENQHTDKLETNSAGLNSPNETSSSVENSNASVELEQITSSEEKQNANADCANVNDSSSHADPQNNLQDGVMQEFVLDDSE